MNRDADRPENREGKQGAIIVMPRRRAEGPPAAGLWTLAGGWATAARRRLGSAWILTLDGVASPEQVLSFADPPSSSVPHTLRFRHVPLVLRTAAKDVVRAYARHTPRDIGDHQEWDDHQIVFVWQHHDLFRSAGATIARRQRCPLVSFVDAPQVWEARRWGVARPGWGHLVERYGEVPQLRASDVVACVSDEVAREVRRLGIGAERIVISPTAVNAEQFTPEENGARVRQALGLADAFVVGWTGTYRRFQGLETLVEGFGRFRRTNDAARLLLVGDGAERTHVEALADRLGLRDSVVSTGAVAPRDVPAYVDAMDVAVVSARSDQGFHYSPLKLREYLACARATLAPRVGEIPGFVDDGVVARLYSPGDASDLAEKLGELAADPEWRARLGTAGRELVLATATWDIRLADLVDSTPFRDAVARSSDRA